VRSSNSLVNVRRGAFSPTLDLQASKTYDRNYDGYAGRTNLSSVAVVFNMNLFRGGGRSFGPTPRSHEIGLPKKVRALALKHALSAKAKDGGIIVVDAVTVKDPKTKALRERFAKLGLENALIIGGAEIENNFKLAARGIPNVDVLPIQGINVYDILRRHTLVLSKDAIDALEARFK